MTQMAAGYGGELGSFSFSSPSCSDTMMQNVGRPGQCSWSFVPRVGDVDTGSSSAFAAGPRAQSGFLTLASMLTVAEDRVEDREREGECEGSITEDVKARRPPPALHYGTPPQLHYSYHPQGSRLQQQQEVNQDALQHLESLQQLQQQQQTGRHRSASESGWDSELLGCAVVSGSGRHPAPPTYSGYATDGDGAFHRSLQQLPLEQGPDQQVRLEALQGSTTVDWLDLEGRLAHGPTVAHGSTWLGTASTSMMRVRLARQRSVGMTRKRVLV
ncbi:hypothetical protein Vretimale_8792 [Volvox reticuliferus]|uniref:Uncharacterized protein n=1 Tax=Volvox reticuliferus TaxID=1737510 RepID=A0A8J4LNM8_9CHLO|nr:hypothetical protein Vretifemale_6327 [Volvox reticuliferus]GIM04166.1 hypothetical protein Vretimale_8792 [Volvox reticuliferus]